ncbi:bifunctional phosphoglucose/phosphomannose isomerase, partial [Candidatus Pacearchaeota archaeon]
MSGRERMLELIRKLPEEFEEALSFDYPDIKGDFERIIIGGMGGSGVGGALLKSYIQNVPIEVIQGYNLPDYVKKNPEKTLFIAVSYSGNTEETISLYKEASLIGLCRIGISSGGKLKELCAKDKVPFIEIPGGFPPRT